MNNQKEYCENLYKECQRLKKKTELKAHDVKSGGEVKSQHVVSLADEQKLNKVKRELKDCLNLLSSKQLMILFEDPNFEKDAGEILMNRKKNRN